MIILFIDTSASDVSIALIKNNIILNKIEKNIPNKHSIYTVSYIDEVLKKSNITPSMVDKIMVVNGPGSFTGLRIGVTIAKVYAYLEKIDIICLSSLKMRVISTNGDYILSLIDAHHNNYYVGLYDKNYDEVINESFSNREDIIKLIDKYNPIIVCNEFNNSLGFDIKKNNLDILKIVNYYKDKKSISPHLTNPNYLKLPQALEEMK